MRKFGVNVKGRVKNYNLPEHKSLMPLFEAVVNSIQAIWETENKHGNIEIYIEREPTISPEIIGRIDNITITDNGIGFNDANFDSFMESDSDYKIEFGGKGVGRFSWLKAFERAEIDSLFVKDNSIYSRKFIFSLSSNSVEDAVVISDKNSILTMVKLCGFKSGYQKNAPIKLETIAIKLIQHCFGYFLTSDCPEISIKDNLGEVVKVNDVFNKEVKIENDKIEYEIENTKFELQKIKAAADLVDKHKLYLCANNRLVDTKDISKYILDLDGIINDGEESFWFVGLITSTYLDENVDMNRLSFSIPEESAESLFPVITIRKIVEQAIEIVKGLLNEYLAPIIENKRKRVRNYITTAAPQYRHLLKYAEEKVVGFKPGLTDDKLDTYLYQLSRDFENENRTMGESLLSALKTDSLGVDEYKSKFETHIARISDENKSILAKYIAHRKSILDLFDFGLKKQSDDKYSKEEFMHNLIYPMKKTSDEISYEEHNLWLIDERLAYFFFASSDIPFNNNIGEERPDIMLFDKSVAMLETENNGTAYDTIVIFELKKPMRRDLNTNNPVEQITEYMQKIKTNTVTDKNGRIIRTDNHTKFYLYVICDMLENYKDKLQSTYGFDETIDGLGMFRMKDNQYIEVLTYDKILNDAKKRNKILFDKLGL